MFGSLMNRSKYYFIRTGNRRRSLGSNLGSLGNSLGSSLWSLWSLGSNSHGVSLTMDW
jgi:hypothetical protein